MSISKNSYSIASFRNIFYSEIFHFMYLGEMKIINDDGWVVLQFQVGEEMFDYICKKFIFSGIKTYRWSMALMSLVFLDYILEMLSKKEGKGMRLFMKKYSRVLLISSPFGVLCMFAYFSINADNDGLLLACGIIHAINTSQSNLEYYTQNVMSITARQKAYIDVFIFCEFFYRMVFLSYFYLLIGKAGISGYMIANFIVSFLIEYLINRHQQTQIIIWLPACFIKGWTSAFYFRLEDTMVQDADEWTEQDKNQDNYRQSQMNSNVIKSGRSKAFILLRLIENIFLTIVGIISFSNQNNRATLFVIAILLLPLYILWHVKYYRFRFASDTKSEAVNHSIEQNAEKYQLSEKGVIQPPMKQIQKKQSDDPLPQNSPEKKFIISDPFHQSEQTYHGNSDSKSHNISKQALHNRNKSSGSMNKPALNSNPINQSELHQNIPIDNDYFKIQESSPFSVQNKKQIDKKIVNNQEIPKDQHEEDNPREKPNLNPFSIE